MARGYYRCRLDSAHRNGRNEVLMPVPVEEDPVVTPPPAYTLSIASTDEENNLVTPPPPYTPSMSSSEAEDNIPMTPPPAYTT